MITATYPIRARRHAGWTDSFLLERENPPIPPATDPTYTPVDLTGYTARLQVREHDDDTSPLLATLDSQAVGIVIDPSTGVITCTLADTLTGLIPAGRWVYDLRVQPPSGDGSYLISGPFIMEGSVTTP